MIGRVGLDLSWFRVCALLVGVVCAGSALSQADSPADEAEVRAAVGAMLDDFLNVRAIRPFAPELSLEEAYRWQDELVEMLRPTWGEVVGFKTGGHNPGPSSRYFPPGGIRAQMLSGMFVGDGAAVRVDEMGAESFLEADFAFRVGSESINEARTDLEILAALDAFVPFAEVPDPTAEPDDNAMVRAVVGNMTSRIALTGEPVPMEPTEEWLDRLNNMEYAVLDENGSVIERRSMADWYQPIDVVRWLRDHLQTYGKKLMPGQLLSLGNLGINRPFFEGTTRGEVYTGNRYRVEYYGLRADGEPATVTINLVR
ncbi:MAG: hypothetical protein OXH27_00390 [Gammaproteobacteria bacterium]|nr:hypothetical protein [Gammaproteobacteria bacterium]